MMRAGVTITRPQKKEDDMTAYNNQNSNNHCSFCSGVNDRVRFSANQDKEESPTTRNKKKGFIGRFLERLEKANEKEFGSGGPCCH